MYLKPSYGPVPQGGDMTQDELAQVLSRIPGIKEDWSWENRMPENTSSPPVAAPDSQHRKRSGSGSNAKDTRESKKSKGDQKEAAWWCVPLFFI